MVKCKDCNGNGSYEIEQNFQSKVYVTPVKCPVCKGYGQITWSQYCRRYRKPKNYHKG